jgi:hypothetical protein
MKVKNLVLGLDEMKLVNHPSKQSETAAEESKISAEVSQ